MDASFPLLRMPITFISRMLGASVILATFAVAATAARSLTPAAVCAQISSSISNASAVYSPGSTQFSADISHWASSSTQQATCTVEPGTASDVSIILRLVGANRTPFAVKGGGHATNQGFSSTTGVHISMTRFQGVNYSAALSQVTFGAGMIWDDVYTALEPYNVSVCGGRVPGIGVAGFTLGGGYSWKVNQHGLTIDTVVAYELVLPSGIITTVTATSHPDLFFALKGGFNNFGIVTRFTLKTFPQTQVWGGLLTFIGDLDLVSAAVTNFAANVTDPKAQLIATFNYAQGMTVGGVYIFYDAPVLPAGIFDELLAIPSVAQDVSTRSLLSMIRTSPSDQTYGLRGLFAAVTVPKFTPALLSAVLNETTFWGTELANDAGVLISYDVEPFLASYLSHGAPSAYPPSRAVAGMPINLFYSWAVDTFDSAFIAAAKASAATLSKVGKSAALPLYPNYALGDTPLAKMYCANVPLLQAMHLLYDPLNVMGLAGGFKF